MQKSHFHYVSSTVSRRDSATGAKTHGPIHGGHIHMLDVDTPFPKSAIKLDLQTWLLSLL